MSDTTEQKPTRRQFLGATAGAVASASLVGQTGRAAAAAPAVAASGRVWGANDRINLAFIGCGMQFLGLLRGFTRRKEQQSDIEYAAVCDVWEPRTEHARKLTGAAKMIRDYREILSSPEIDGVVLAVPDHWHFKMAREACESGKDVYLEKPMTHTIEEADQLESIVGATQRILQVGGSGPAEKLNWQIYDYVQSGKMGKILWALISYNRNTREGMWDYPIPGIGSQHWPDAEVAPGRNLDWELWLGPAPKRPYSDERYFRWRKYWDYSGGNATDLLFHRLGTMSTMIGFDFPTRATGAGGIYVQKNREVPDTYMSMVEYPGGYSINMISCMANSRSVPLTVYGNWATLEVLTDTIAQGDSMGDQSRDPRRQRRRTYARITPERTFMEEFKRANGGLEEINLESESGPDLIDDWLDCMRSRKEPLYNVRRGHQVMVGIKLGVESYRQGRVMAYDPDTGRIVHPPDREEYLPADA
jgi:predicted dehydrogenase